MICLQKCTMCGLEKELSFDNFSWRKDNNKWREECKKCRVARQKEYVKHNPVNKERVHKCQKEWYELHKKEIRAKERERRQNDPAFRCRKTVSLMVNLSLKKQGSTKNGRSVSEFLEINKMFAHLQSKYEWWMTDKNQGVYSPKTWDDNDSSTWTWQIDHIIPQSDLPYFSMIDNNFKKCWSLENLRPLNSKQNIFDGSNKVRHL